MLHNDEFDHIRLSNISGIFQMCLEMHWNTKHSAACLIKRNNVYTTLKVCFLGTCNHMIDLVQFGIPVNKHLKFFQRLQIEPIPPAHASLLSFEKFTLLMNPLEFM